MTKIYTRTGDKGMTSLNGGMRVLKSEQRVETYGVVDELNSSIGIAVASIVKRSLVKTKKELEHIQHDLFSIGSTLADPENPSVSQLEERVKEFETLIDAMTENLPPLRNFILPGGSIAGSQLHLSR